MHRLLGWVRISLRLALVLSGAVVLARATFGPFRFIVSVHNPIGAESVFALSAVLLLILEIGRAHV